MDNGDIFSSFFRIIIILAKGKRKRMLKSFSEKNGMNVDLFEDLYLCLADI